VPRFCTSIVLGLLVCAGLSLPAHAETLEVGLLNGTIVWPVLGLVGGAQLGSLPLSVQGNAWAAIGMNSVFSYSLWMQTTPLIPPESPSFGVFGGLCYAYQAGGRLPACVPIEEEEGESAPVDCTERPERKHAYAVGAVYQQSWNGFWLRAKPTMLLGAAGVTIPFITPGQPGGQEDLMSLPPLLEIGYRLRGTSVSLRTALPFMAISQAF
jgi:hypothetical protein